MQSPEGQILISKIFGLVEGFLDVMWMERGLIGKYA